MNDIEKRAAQWIVNRDTGLSSVCLWARMMGVKAGDNSHPRDGDDLGRCVRLLEFVPEWKHRLSEMEDVSAYWSVVIRNWDSLAEVLKNELAGLAAKGSTYKAMRALFDPIEETDKSVVRLGSGVTLSFGRSK